MPDLFSKDPFKNFFGDLQRESSSLFASAEEKLTEAKQALNKVNKSVADGVLTLETDLPGVKKKDLTVSLTELADAGTRVVVLGQRGETSIKFGVTLVERLDETNAVAELSNGVLKITAPVISSPVLKTTELKVV